MKAALKGLLRSAGIEIKRLRTPAAPGSEHRGSGDFTSFLEDVKARGFHPGTILDVGANEAGWSRMAKSIFPSARCMLIEPQEEMRPALESFCREYPDSKYFLAGAGAVPGQLELNVFDDLVGSSFIPESSSAPDPTKKRRTVPIRTLDELVANGEMPQPDMAKLDVQGFELEVLKGASTVLPKIELIILEVSLYRFQPVWPIFHEVVAFMAEHGFYAYDIAGYLRRPLDGAVGQTDVCFAREGGLLRKHSNWG